MSEVRIPFNKPAVLGQEFDYIRQAIERGKISGDGHFTRLCQDLLKTTTGAAGVLLTTSCTHALEMAALLLDVQPGDEVILPSFTFVSTANAFVLRGARPVFVDSRADTLNLDENQIEARLTQRTKVIVPVHYAGVGCAMDRILQIANSRGIHVVEDNAHGLFGRYRGRPLGSFGSMATQSFHETKNISCGEGGALLINDASLVERAEIIREKGTDRSRFFRGQVDKYSWIDIGSSYLMSDILAAFLLGQLEKWEWVQARRREIWNRYHVGLAVWAGAHDVMQPQVPAHCDHANHMYYLLAPSLESRDRLIAHLKAHGILSVFHYLPLHTSLMGRSFGGRPGDCPVAEELSDRLLRLPFFNCMKDDDQMRVIEAVTAFDFR